MKKLTLIKNKSTKKTSPLIKEIKALKKELNFLNKTRKLILNSTDDYLILKEGVFGKNDLKEKLSLYNIALIKQKLKKLEYEEKKSHLRIVSSNHLTLVSND